MAQTSIILRLELNHERISFGDVAAAISKAGGDVTSIDVIRAGKDTSIRDITVDVAEAAETQVVGALKRHEGIKLINVSDRTFLVHLGGKIAVQPNVPIRNREDLSRYTQRGWRVCARRYTRIRRRRIP